MTVTRRPFLATFAVAVALLSIGCGPTAPSPTPGATSAAASRSVAAPPSPTPPNPAAREAALAAAMARWDSLRLSTFAYTVSTWNGSPFTVPPSRVVSLEGDLRVDGDRETAGALTPDGLFDRVRAILPLAPEVQYDAATGLPIAIRADGPPGSSDMATDITVTDFVVASPGATVVAKRVEEARTAWAARKPSSYAYTWTRTAVGGNSPAASFAVDQAAGGTAVFEPAATSAGQPSATVVSVPATLDAARTAAADGAWVDLTVDAHGVPILLAIDPSPAAGDAFWIRIDFRDVEHEQAEAAYRAALDRWSAAGLQRYRYVWHYHGRAGTYTYRVTMRGEVSLLTRSKGSRVLWQAFDFGPRLDVVFATIGQELGSGGRVTATYDPVHGYPTRVVLADAAGNSDGTIEISAFTVQ